MPRPSNYQKVSRTIRFQYVLTMVLRLEPESKSGILIHSGCARWVGSLLLLEVYLYGLYRRVRSGSGRSFRPLPMADVSSRSI